jgi:uncharacterized protein YneF (UPF0154 family)
LIAVVAFVGGGFVGFFACQKIMKNQMKKTPPINENMIRAMYAQIGRKPSESQIKQMMSRVKEQMH